MRLYKFLNEDANTHSTHIEELFITKGKAGLDAALSALGSIVQSIGAGNPPISLKVDGAPAIVAGWLGGKFFVASKSLFNKTPKINFTVADIDTNHPSGPNKQLKIALQYLGDVIPKGKIYQGDYLYDKSTLKSTGNDIAFQPNTLIYTVDKSSDLGKQILSSQMGIAFHTEYTATTDDPKSITLKGFGVKLNSTRSVFCLDVNVQNVSDTVSFSSAELTKYRTLIRKAQSINVPWDIISKYQKEILKNNNDLVRAGTYGKLSAMQMYSSIVDKENTFSEISVSVYELLLTLLELKELVMNKLQDIGDLRTFVQKSDGALVVTSQEGYVVVSGPGNSAKLVNRLDFSRNNFSAEIVKGWAKS